MDIKEFFEINNKVAIAFSGGVDSVYLLYAAAEAGADVTAYYVKSQFQPEFEFSDAKELAAKIGAKMRILTVDALADPAVRRNPANRCYYCKQHIMGAIMQAAREDGYEFICDGTNASDDADDRPGYKALQEFGIRSPLRECGLTKARIRELSKDAGLKTWNKPSYACLATRVPAGEEITNAKLEITEKAEEELFRMGFTDFRARMRGDAALLQFRADQREEAVRRFDEIKAAIGGWYSDVRIDEATR